MSLNGMAESRRRRCYRAVWLKCSKTVAVQSQVLPVRRGRDFKKARKIVRQTQAPSPVFFIEAPGRPVFSVSLAARPITEGARDARGPSGPTGLDASRHRGLSKSFVPAARTGLRDAARPSASPPKPKASRARCLVGLLREGPRGRPFTRLSATTVEDQALGRRPSDGDPGTGHQGPRRIARSAGSFAAWTAGPSQGASPLQGHPPGHRLPPRVWRR